ncbi:hypothetical protein GCM10028822_31850 [Hymenobacter terrigena]
MARMLVALMEYPKLSTEQLQAAGLGWQAGWRWQCCFSFTSASPALPRMHCGW